MWGIRLSASYSRGPAASAQRLLASTWIPGREGRPRRHDLAGQERFEVERRFREDGADLDIAAQGTDILGQRAKQQVRTVLDRRYARLVDPQLARSEEHTSELQSLRHLVCRLL